MTAFLIESYTLLNEDPSDAVIRLLERLVDQTESYHLVNGSLNSTASLRTASQPFSPPPSVIHVNVLWFASLMFSLITASYGMLVKQWLREYLAVDYVSPQARLRVRQFRHPGLKDWRVFEIAAMLPLLLQLALGLFFVGLCIFTWSVHPAIGRTTTPLVAGWAFLFVAATLAPIVSPRCPYKPTFLRTPVSQARRWLRSLRPARSSALGKRSEPQEEGDAAVDETRDVDILISLDEVLLDDQLIATTMLDCLQQFPNPLPSLVKLMKHVLAHRMHQDGDALVIPLDTGSLNEGQWSLMISCLTNALVRELSTPGTKAMTHPEMEALFMVMSPSKYLYPPHIESVVTQWITNPSICTSLNHALSCEGSIRATPAPHLESLLSTVRLLANKQVLDGSQTVIALDHVALWCIQRHAGGEVALHISTGGFTIVGSTALVKAHITPLGCRTISQTLIGVLLLHVNKHRADSIETPAWVTRALSTWLIVINVLSAHGGSWLYELDFKHIFSRLLAAPSDSRALLRCLLDADWELVPGSEIELRLRSDHLHASRVRLVEFIDASRESSYYSKTRLGSRATYTIYSRSA